MKNAFSGLLLSSLFLAGSVAQAATQVSTSGFDLTMTDSMERESFGMNVVSDVGGTIKIAMKQAATRDFSVLADGGEIRSTGDYGWTRLAGAVRQGYQITSLTLSGTVTGLLKVGKPDCVGCYWYGDATNDASIQWTLTQPGARTGPAEWKTESLNGVSNFSLSSALHTSGAFVFDIDSLANVYAASTVVTIDRPSDYPTHYYLPSQSAIRFSDVVLTAHVSAVPEPETYAMLLAGLGLVALARRRVNRR